jgi:hypothetical protein
MKPTLIVLAVAVACSTAIAADSPAPTTSSMTAAAEDCATLQAKYDGADKSQVSPNKMKNAKAQRVKGGNLCAQGNKTEGIKALKNALADIGMN